MRARWAGRYVGLPFAPLGRDRHGLDCYGLLALVYREQFGIILPEYSYPGTLERGAVATVADEAAAGECWQPTPSPAPGDAVLLALLALPVHCAIVVGDGYMLHALARANSCIERYNGPLWQRRIVGFYRHRDMLCATSQFESTPKIS